MIETVKKHWKTVGAGLLFVLALTSVAAAIIDAHELEQMKSNNTQMAQQIMKLQKQINENRTVPEEFPDEEYLKAWLLVQQIDSKPTLERAVQLQQTALADGWLMQYMIVVGATNGEAEFWPTTKISEKIYCVEPVTNTVRVIWPGTWWTEGSKLPKLPDIKIPDIFGTQTQPKKETN